MCFKGVAGLRRIELILEKDVKSLSCTEFHNCVECSFDMDIMPFAVPFRMKSASFTLLINVSWMSKSGPSPSTSFHGSSGWYRSQSSPTGRFLRRIPSCEKLEAGPKNEVSRGRRSGR